jgi:diketogulonate reductase-like aldo/keto reductase
MVAKSMKKERLKENIEIFDWELTDEDRFKIAQIPQHKKVTVLGILSPEGVPGVDLSEVDVVEV